jgi:hypothetical protein
VLPEDDRVFTKAQVYLCRVQNLGHAGRTVHTDTTDGGFFTSITTPETNKSRQFSETKWGSYATATCDGMLALAAAGVAATDARFIQAVKWIDSHREMQYPEGIPPDHPLQWHRVMKYYHLAVRAETCVLRRCDPQTIEDITSILRKDQRKDGSFMNPMGGPNKEDDPLLATALAVIAMSE